MGFLCYGYYCSPFAMASFSAPSMALSYVDMSSTALSSSDSLGAVAATMRPSFCCLDGLGWDLGVTLLLRPAAGCYSCEGE